ncbi:MAG: hypothetical protein ACD_73C00814G0002 [uncultured bacterium]|nr:MAG: hypothetical protein ACD_73C00814G0002 [uncultured bacterium]
MPLLNDILNAILGAMRVGGLLVAMPVFGTGTIPVFVKVALALAIGASMSGFMGIIPESIFYNNDIIVLIIMREISIGLFIGFTIRLIFVVVSMSLEYAGIQMGFAMANIFDPTNASQVTVLGQIGSILAILIFFTTNMHHDFFVLVARSYHWWPVGVPDFNISAMANQFIDLIKKSFELSLRIAMPVMVVMLVIHTIMGVIAKAAPQMNLFFNVAIILNVVIGVIMVMMMLPQILNGVNQMENIIKGSFGV